MKQTLRRLLWFFIFLAACRGEPTFIHHPAPDLTVDALPNVANTTALGCSEIWTPPNLLGGLNPRYPIAMCAIDSNRDQWSDELQEEIEGDQFVYYTGGLFGYYVRYVIQQDDQFVVLKTEAEFRDVFAPIESPEEALSYVLGVRNFSAYYDLQYDPAYEYEVDSIEDTHVSAGESNYLVHLFYNQVFGCGPHWTSAVDVRVSRDGEVEQVASKPLYRDPSMDEVCVD